jgi:REP element-mobilizing transposase RayT
MRRKGSCGSFNCLATSIIQCQSPGSIQSPQTGFRARHLIFSPHLWLRGEDWRREPALRELARFVELGVQIVSGVLSREQVHMFVEIPPHIAVSDFVRRVKGRSSHQVQMEFPDLRKRWNSWLGRYLYLSVVAYHHRVRIGSKSRNAIAGETRRP